MHTAVGGWGRSPHDQVQHVWRHRVQSHCQKNSMRLLYQCVGEGICSLLCKSVGRRTVSHVQQPDNVLNAGCRLERGQMLILAECIEFCGQSCAEQRVHQRSLVRSEAVTALGLE